MPRFLRSGQRAGRHAGLGPASVLAALCVVATLLGPGTASAAKRRAAAHAGDTKTNCIYLGSTSVSSLAPALASAEALTHVTFNCLQLYATTAPTWTEWDSPWMTSPQFGWSSWLEADRAHQVVLTMQMIPESVSKKAKGPAQWEVPCDRGAYDREAAALGRNLVAAGFGHAVIRLGSEASGVWEPDFVGTTRADGIHWARCFDREVAAMRRAKGQHFLFDLTYDSCYDYLPFSSYYPGNAYVDILGLDVYDQSCDLKLPGPSVQRWRALRADVNGLDTLQAFARAHHKPMSFAEWGLLQKGVGDDPYLVAGLGRFIRANDVAYQCYFDAGDIPDVLPLGPEVPRSLAAYRRAFAPPPPSSPTTTSPTTTSPTTTTSPGTPPSTTPPSTTTTSPGTTSPGTTSPGTTSTG